MRTHRLRNRSAESAVGNIGITWTEGVTPFSEGACIERELIGTHIFSKFSGRSPLSHFAEL